MKRLMALAACGLVLLPSTPALSWGSTTTGGIWPAKFNTHACLDKMAYAFLEKDPAFQGAKFPALADILAHEGADITQSGPGPDAKGSSNYSLHWYNARNQEGHAPQGVATNFLTLAYGQAGREKGAAWAAHFLADAHVPYHINGEYASDLRAQVAAHPGHVVLDEKVTGDRSLFGRSSSLVSEGSVHDDDFTVEANRFLEAAQGDDKLDWFDPWFWDGSTDTMPYATSSHVLWEGLHSPECPRNPVNEYSVYWTGNPQTQFGDPTRQLNAAVSAFTVAMATDARDNAAARLANGGVGEALAADSIATLWRASFSALRAKAVIKFDPTTLDDPNQTPVADVAGELANVAPETAHQVQVRLRVVSGNCRVIDAHEVQAYGDLAQTSVDFGDWKLQVPRPGVCHLSIEAIGRYYNTPDLQLTWRNLTVSAPALAAPPPSECNCKPGDTLCLTLCHHNPGQPPSNNNSGPTRKHCTTPTCVEPVDEE